MLTFSQGMVCFNILPPPIYALAGMHNLKSRTRNRYRLCLWQAKYDRKPTAYKMTPGNKKDISKLLST